MRLKQNRKRLFVGSITMFFIASCFNIAKAGETASFEEEDYILQLHHYEETLNVEEISYDPETDWDWSYYGGNHISKIAKGKNGYYIRLGDYLYFCSFEKEKLVPLCARPDCLHNKEESLDKKEQCMAYLGYGNITLFSGIQVNNEKLYANFSVQNLAENGQINVGDDLYSIKMDGSSREKLNLNMENASRFYIHRGMVYYVTHESDPKSLTETECLYRMPLSGGKQVEIAKVQGKAIFELYPYGNYVYGWCGMDDVAYNFIYDIENDKTTARQFEEENIIFFIPNEDGFIGTENDNVFEISPDLQNVEQVGTLTAEDKQQFGVTNSDEFWLYSFISEDDQYLYLQGSVGANFKDIVAIYDKQNLELQQIIFVDGIADSQCIAVDEDVIFFTGKSENGDAVFWLEKEKMLDQDVHFHVIEPN